MEMKQKQEQEDTGDVERRERIRNRLRDNPDDTDRYATDTINPLSSPRYPPSSSTSISLVVRTTLEQYLSSCYV